MKILVTGGAGFIGSHLVDRLIKEGNEVSIIDNLSTGDKSNLNPKAHFYEMDICSSRISDVFKREQPTVVFHLAAQIDVRKSVADSITDAKINILGSLNIIQNFISINQSNQHKSVVPKIIFASSGGAIYGDADIIPTPETYPAVPLSPYGCAKLSAEKYLNYYYQVFNLPFTILRLANVYGPRQNSEGEAGVVAIFYERMIGNKEVVIYGDGKQTRDFVYVGDVVKAALLAMESQEVGIYNIGTAKETDINTIFEKIKYLLKLDIKPIYRPAKKGEQKRSCLDYSLAKKLLRWKPEYSLDKGLKEMIDWFKEMS